MSDAEQGTVVLRERDCVSSLRMIETMLPKLIMKLMRSTVKVTDADESQFCQTGVVEDVTLCGIRQRQGTVGYVGLRTAMFYVVVRLGGRGRSTLRRYRIDQLELVQPEALH